MIYVYDFLSTELGPIPEHFQIKQLGKIAEVTTGKTPPTKNDANYGGAMPFVTVSDMESKPFILDSEKQLTNRGEENSPLIKQGSLLVSCIGSIGKVQFIQSDMYVNQQINSVYTEESLREYLYFKIQTLPLDEYAGGTAQPIISKSDLSKMEILLPDKDKLLDFHNKTQQFFEQIRVLSEERQILEELRDYILPILLSGNYSIDRETSPESSNGSK